MFATPSNFRIASFQRSREPNIMRSSPHVDSRAQLRFSSLSFHFATKCDFVALCSVVAQGIFTRGVHYAAAVSCLWAQRQGFQAVLAPLCGFLKCPSFLKVDSCFWHRFCLGWKVAQHRASGWRMGARFGGGPRFKFKDKQSISNNKQGNLVFGCSDLGDP